MFSCWKQSSKIKALFLSKRSTQSELTAHSIYLWIFFLPSFEQAIVKLFEHSWFFSECIIPRDDGILVMPVNVCVSSFFYCVLPEIFHVPNFFLPLLYIANTWTQTKEKYLDHGEYVIFMKINFAGFIALCGRSLSCNEMAGVMFVMLWYQLLSALLHGDRASDRCWIGV